MLFPKTLYLIKKYIKKYFIGNIWHGKWSTMFGRFLMKGIPGSQIYFYYSKNVSKKFHDDWWKKKKISPAENNSVFKGLKEIKTWLKPSVATELTLVIAMRTIAKINFKIILNFFILNHDLILWKSRIL